MSNEWRTDETPLTPDPRRISNSEVQTWQSCRRKYWFAFILKLEKVNKSEALTRGIIGHEVLEVYYKSLKDGNDHDKAMSDARATLSAIMISGSADMSLCLEIDALLARYWSYYNGHPEWEILEVEEDRDLPMTEDFTMPMRLDLLVRNVNTNKIYIVDHKFCYDFWGYHDIALSAQFPKYVAGMRYAGVQIDGCILNQIRYRKMKDMGDPTKFFKMEPVVPSNSKVKNAIREHVITCSDIVEFRSKPLDVQDALSTHCLNKMICKGCDFKDVCAAEFDGGDTDFILQNEYKKNSYDYNQVVDITEGL